MDLVWPKSNWNIMVMMEPGGLPCIIGWDTH